MKSLLSLSFRLAIFLAPLSCITAQAVGIGTSTPDGSSILEVESTTKGMLVPRMTTAERTAIATPATGLLVYDTDTQSFWFRNSTAWVNTNDLQTIANTSDGTSHTATLSNSGGSTKLVEGTGITLTTTGSTLDGIATIATTALLAEVDGSITNELQTLANTSDATSHTATLSNSGGSTQFVEGNGITLTTTGSGLDGVATIATTALLTEVDGSVTNEGSLTVAAGTTTTSLIHSNTSGTTDVTLNAGTGLSISENTGTGNITLTNTGVITEVDGSTTNELQTLANTSDATSHTATLSNSGGSLHWRCWSNRWC